MAIDLNDHFSKLQPLEKALVGLCMDGHEYLAIRAEIDSSDFLDKELGEIYHYIASICTDQVKPDFMAVSSRIRPELYGKLQECAEMSFSTQNLSYIVSRIKGAAKYRKQLKQIAQVYSNALFSDPLDPVDLTEQLSALISTENMALKVKSFNENLIQETLDGIEKEVCEGGTKAIKSGIKRLDAIIGGGFKKGKVYTIAARPGCGKTALATFICYRAAMEGYHPFYITNEVLAPELTERVLATDTQIDGEHIERRVLNDQELNAIVDSGRKLQGMKFSVCDSSQGRWENTAGLIRHLCKYQKIDLVVIDYIQQFSLANKKLNSREELVKITDEVKKIANQMEVPILMLCQMNRAIETRVDKRPSTADLKESGSIEQDSDVVISLYYDGDTDLPRGGKHDDLWLMILKNRRGKLGNFPLKTNLATNTFAGEDE